jgi:agmatinase
MVEVNSPEDAEIILQKLPSDMGIHRNPRKGTLDAPEEILEDFSTEKDILVEDVFPDEFSLENTQDRIEENTKELLEYGKPIVSLGGDHSVSFPVIRVLKEENPDLKLVWLDAHLDLKEKVDGHVSHDVVVRELLENGFSEDEIFFVGVTRIDEDEEDFLDGRDMKIYRPGEIEEFKREFKKGEHPFYLSVDVDVLEESLAPGTGYLDGELKVEDVLELIDDISPDYADLVEVAPPFDKENRTVKNSKAILEKILKEAG